MNKVQHRSHNRVLGAPRGWDQRELPCDALSVRDDLIGGHSCVVSHWRPTKEELVALNAGALIALVVVGPTMPPVALWLESE